LEYSLFLKYCQLKKPGNFDVANNGGETKLLEFCGNNYSCRNNGSAQGCRNAAALSGDNFLRKRAWKKNTGARLKYGFLKWRAAAPKRIDPSRSTVNICLTYP